jgi:hypothetical protein
MRALLGFAGLAAVTAITTAVVRPPVVGIPSSTTETAVAPATAPVRHVTRYVQLQPGQTAPPHATVRFVPQPTPRVVIVTTHQSGVP